MDDARKKCYSPLKVFHHRDRIESLQQGRHPAPVHVHLVPTNHCNAACKWCAYRQEGYTSSETFDTRDEIHGSRLIDLITELAEAGVKGIEFTGGGEPTIHRHFPDACIRAKNLGIDYGIVTNGVRMSDDTLYAMRNATWVRFSVDAGNAQTYSDVKGLPPQIYSQVIDNIRQIVRHRSQDPVVGVGFVVTKENYTEILDAVRIAEENGVDNVRISAVFSSEGADYYRGIYPEARDLCLRAKKLSNGSFTVFDLFTDRMADLEQANPDYSYCGVQRLVCYIGADLNVYRCCVLAYNEQGLLGSVKDQTFGEFWNSPETRAKLDDFDAKTCARCMFNAKNRTIAYAMDNNPEHVNFL